MPATMWSTTEMYVRILFSQIQTSQSLRHPKYHLPRLPTKPLICRSQHTSGERLKCNSITSTTFFHLHNMRALSERKFHQPRWNPNQRVSWKPRNRKTHTPYSRSFKLRTAMQATRSNLNATASAQFLPSEPKSKICFFSVYGNEIYYQRSTITNLEWHSLANSEGAKRLRTTQCKVIEEYLHSTVSPEA